LQKGVLAKGKGVVGDHDPIAIGSEESRRHIRRDDKGDVAKQTEAPHCTDCHCVNAEATSMKNVTLTLGDLILICRRYGRVSKKEQHSNPIAIGFRRQ
jgi:hypothetical protein